MGPPGQLCRVFCGDAVEGAVGGGSGMMDMEAEATMAQQLSLGRTRALKGLEPSLQLLSAASSAVCSCDI